jgi:hypothetical protein
MRWYGYQTLALDGLAFLLAVPGLAGGTNSGNVAAAIGGTIYTLGAPIVHVAHLRPLAGLGDLGMRLALPVVSALVGAAAGLAFASHPHCGDSNADRCPYWPPGLEAGLEVGLAVGVAGAIAIDAALIAREPAPDATPSLPPWAVSFLPMLTVTREGPYGTRTIAGAVVSF